MKISILVIVLNTILSATNAFSQTPYLYNNFPLHLDSIRDPFRKAGIPLISDLDKDGQKEIITYAVDYEGAANPLSQLYVIKSDATGFENFPKGYNELILDIASGDVNGDGILDIAIRMTSLIDVIDRFGNHLKGFPVSFSDGTFDPINFISLYDLDDNGKLEVIVNKIGNISVFNFDGSLREGWPKYIPGRANYNPAIGDLDNDGKAEIIISSFKMNNTVIDSGSINIFRHNGNLYSNNWPKYLDSGYCSWSSSPSLYVNKESPSLAYFTIPLDKSSSSSFKLHKFIKFDTQGNIMDVKYYEAFMDFGTLVMGDIDNNNTLEYSSGTQYGVTLSAFNNSLNTIEGWPAWGNGEHYATAVIGKLTTQSNLNVVNNSWSAASKTGEGYIYAYSLNGNNLPWSPLRPYGIAKAVSFADLNNDGNVELIATTFAREGSFLYAWTIPGAPYSQINFPWPQYGHDRYRTNQYGFIPPDEPVGIQPMNTNIPAAFNLYQNFPNPFNPATSIKFDIAKKGNVKLVVFDMLGRELSTLINESINPGTYQVSFDASLHGQGSGLSSGIYFCRLQSEDYVYTMKMNLIK